MGETSGAKDGREGALTLDSVVVATRHQASCALGEEAVVLEMNAGVYFGLNQVGARVWELVKTPRSVRSILDTLLAEYEVEPERCHEDLLSVLDKMRSAGLVETGHE
jgi:hypothetical protein